MRGFTGTEAALRWSGCRGRIECQAHRMRSSWVAARRLAVAIWSGIDPLEVAPLRHAFSRRNEQQFAGTVVRSDIAFERETVHFGRPAIPWSSSLGTGDQRQRYRQINLRQRYGDQPATQAERVGCGLSIARGGAGLAGMGDQHVGAGRASRATRRPIPS